MLARTGRRTAARAVTVARTASRARRVVTTEAAPKQPQSVMDSIGARWDNLTMAQVSLCTAVVGLFFIAAQMVLIS